MIGACPGGIFDRPCHGLLSNTTSGSGDLGTIGPL